MKRLRLLSVWGWIAIAGIAAPSACGTAGERNSDAINVILISIDCLNQRQFETGVREGYTPEFAELAADAMAFSRGYTHAPWTTPSHASMMTGLYPHQHGHTRPYRLMLDERGRKAIESELANLPESLAANGYETVGFVGQGPISAHYGLGRGFASYHESPKNFDQSDFPETLDGFRDWLDLGGDAPFFAFIHTFDLHDPRPPSRERDREAISYIDRRIGELIATLTERGLYENSLIILTGDHGSMMIRTEGKCCIHGAGHYEENLKVPLLVKLPDRFHRGSARGDDKLRGSSDAIARHVDLLPTVADVLGIALPDYRGPGVSLVDVVTGRASSAYSYSEADARCSMRFALVSNDHKYIFTPRDAVQRQMLEAEGFRDKYCVDACSFLPKREEFFDLRADPFEQRDLLLGPLEPEQAERLAEMRVAFAQHRRLETFYSERPLDPAEAPAPDAGLIDSLRKLGYLE